MAGFSSGEAATRNWQGANNANWNGWFSWGFFTPYPDAVDDVAQFNTAGGNNVNVNGTYTIGTLNLAGDAHTFNNGTLIFRVSSGNAELNNSSANAQIINSGLVLSNTLDISHTGSGFLTLNGGVSGGGGINKSGSGTTILTGSNSYLGTTAITGGVLVAANKDALGSTTNGTSVGTNSALYLSNNITISNEALSLAGTGISTNGALSSISGTNAFTGLITATNATTAVGAATNAMLVISNVNSGSQQLWVVGDGTTLIAGGVTNSGSGTNFVKTDSGTAILAGSNSWGGSKYILEGTVVMSNNNAFGTNGTIYLGNTGTNTPNATLRLGTGITNSRSIAVVGTGINANPRMLSYDGSGNATQLGGVTLSSNNLTVSNTTSGTLTLAGDISGTGGMIKIGNGTTVVTGSNSYTGNTVISSGAYLIAHSSALGATNGGVTVSNNAALLMSNTITVTNKALTLVGMGPATNGALQSVSGSNAFTGPITATNAATALGASTNATLVVSNINSGSQQLWVTGEGTTIITGTVTNSGSGTNFVKTNSGVAILAGSNAWTGSKYIQEGTVVMSNNNAFGTNGTTYLGAAGTNMPNATLQLGTGITNSRPISVTGTGATDASRALTYSGTGTATQLGGITLNSNSLHVSVSPGGTLNFGSTVTVNTGPTNDNRLIFDGGGTVIVTNNGTAPSSDRYQVRIADATVILGSGALSTRTNVGGIGHAIDLGIGTNWSVPNATSTLLLSNGVTANNPIFVASPAGGDRVLGISGAGTATFSGPIGIASMETNSRGLTVSADAGGTAVFSGAITNFSGGADNKVTKVGAGAVSLAGTNSYGGPTTISNGTLNVWLLADAGVVSSIGTNGTLILAGSNSAAAVLNYGGTNVTMNRQIVATNGGGTITMGATNTVVTVTGSASGSGTIEVGQGTLVLSNTSTPNSFAPAAIKVDSGGTLKLAANNQIGDSTGLILNGGTLVTGTSSTRYSETLGTLTLTANSTLDLGSWSGGSNTLQFADSSGITWAPGAILTITNWQGTPYTPSMISTILFGSAGLTGTQLAQIQFANQGNLPGGFIGNELVPVPEPRVYIAAAALLAAIGWRERRRLKRMLTFRAKPGSG